MDTITLKITTTSEVDKSDENNKQQEEKPNIDNNNKNNKPTDNTLSKTDLPKTGVNNIIYIVILFSVSLIIIFSIKLKKYKDIK